MDRIAVATLHLALHFAITNNSGVAFSATIIEDIIHGGLKEPDPMIQLNAPGIIQHYGYPCEIHHINSSNYRLEMHRIPNGLNQSNPSTRHTVLLLHGFISTSVVYILYGPQKSLGYVLADNGYDVWMANMRGNLYSRYNYNITTHDPNFWKFGFDEGIGDDLPSMIDYILEKTSTEKLYIIAHSAGNKYVYGLLASKSEYNSKVTAVISLGPVQLAIDPVVTNSTLLTNFSMSELLNVSADGPYWFDLAPKLFHYNKALNLMINSIYLLLHAQISGDGPEVYDQEHLTFTISKNPSTSSLRALKHGMQTSFGGFMKYDFGPLKNMDMYNQLSPPVYNLSQVTAPVYIFITQNDPIGTNEAAQYLRTSLTNCKGIFHVGSSYAGHKWLLFGKDMDTQLFPYVLKAMNNATL